MSFKQLGEAIGCLSRAAVVISFSKGMMDSFGPLCDHHIPSRTTSPEMAIADHRVQSWLLSGEWWQKKHGLSKAQAAEGDRRDEKIHGSGDLLAVADVSVTWSRGRQVPPHGCGRGSRVLLPMVTIAHLLKQTIDACTSEVP